MSSLFDDVTVVLYLRRQPEYLVSRYYTLVTTGSSSSFYDHINLPEEQSFLAYHRMVKNWSVFGKDNIKIRIFDKKEFHENDLLSDFAFTAGFDMKGLQPVKNENVSSLDSASVEFLRLINLYYPKMEGPLRASVGRSVLKRVYKRALNKNEKAYHLSRGEAQMMLDTFREGNNWIAREFLGKDSLFHDDVSMYPEEIASPHNLTPEQCAEITARIWEESGSVLFLLERLIRNIGKNCCHVFKS